MLIRATARLRKRLRLPSNPAEPAAPPANPLGEWYADIDFIDRKPFVLLLNAATGAGMVLPGRAPDLRSLHLHAGQQFFKLLLHYGFELDSPQVASELQAWNTPARYAKTQDRSLLGSMNRFKGQAWDHFVWRNRSLPEAAARQWEGLFRHPSLAAPGEPSSGSAWHRPLDLVRARLLPESASPARATGSRH